MWKAILIVILISALLASTATFLTLWLMERKSTKKAVDVPKGRTTVLHSDTVATRLSARASEDREDWPENANEYLLPSSFRGQIASLALVLEAEMPEFVAEDFSAGAATAVVKTEDADKVNVRMELLGTYTPGAADLTMHDFDLATKTTLHEGKMPTDVTVKKCRRMVLLMSHIDMDFEYAGRAYGFRVALSDTTTPDGAEMKRGDKMLRTGSTWKFLNIATSELQTTRPEHTQCIPGIRDATLLDSVSTSFYPLHVPLRRQLDLEGIAKASGVLADVNFELRKFLVLVGQRDATAALTDVQLMQLLTITQPQYNMGDNMRDEHGNGRPAQLDQLPFDPHFLPVDAAGFPEVPPGFAIDASGTLLCPSGKPAFFVPAAGDQVYPGVIDILETQASIASAPRLFEKPEDVHLEDFENNIALHWTPGSEPPVPAGFTKPTDGTLFVPGTRPVKHGVPPPSPKATVVKALEAQWSDDHSFEDLGTSDGLLIGPPPALKMPVPPPSTCDCAPNPFKRVAGLVADVTLTIA